MEVRDNRPRPELKIAEGKIANIFLALNGVIITLHTGFEVFITKTELEKINQSIPVE